MKIDFLYVIALIVAKLTQRGGLLLTFVITVADALIMASGISH
jgi:hypothetical protein